MQKWKLIAIMPSGNEQVARFEILEEVEAFLKRFGNPNYEIFDKQCIVRSDLRKSIGGGNGVSGH